MLTVVVTSQNPVKKKAVQQAFQRAFPKEKFTFTAITVASEVPDQPKGSAQTRAGAENRVRNGKKEKPNADYWVGLEAGIEINRRHELRLFSWVAIEDKTGLTGSCHTGSFLLPPSVRQYIDQGVELGEAMDQILQDHNTKQKGGAAGHFTKGLVPRAEGFTRGVIFALVPFMNRSWYS